MWLLSRISLPIRELKGEEGRRELWVEGEGEGEGYGFSVEKRNTQSMKIYAVAIAVSTGVWGSKT